MSADLRNGCKPARRHHAWVTEDSSTMIPQSAYYLENAHCELTFVKGNVLDLFQPSWKFCMSFQVSIYHINNFGIMCRRAPFAFRSASLISRRNCWEHIRGMFLDLWSGVFTGMAPCLWWPPSQGAAKLHENITYLLHKVLTITLINIDYRWQLMLFHGTAYIHRKISFQMLINSNTRLQIASGFLFNHGRK